MSLTQKFPESWQNHWEEKEFTKASLIQEKSFQPLLEKNNVLGISPTGSGKTLAYLLPLLLNVEQGKGSQLLILAPSQELAVQINKVVQEWATLIQLKTQALIGGANVQRQITKLKEKPEILVGTPGRVYELIKAKKLKSHQLNTIVLDEVDQLFKDQEMNLAKKILTSAPKEFQVVFYSATAGSVIEEAEQLAANLQVIDVTKEDTSAGAIQHYFMLVSNRKKVEILRSLNFVEGFRGLVFCNQLGELGTMMEKLSYHQIPAVDLASDQNKQWRKMAVEQFATGKVNLLLTTDVGARGLDFQEIPFVINTEIPLTEESYLHRAGRVGRMGADGAVITFIHEGIKRDYQRLMKKLDYSFQEIFLGHGQLYLEEDRDNVKEYTEEIREKKKKSVKKRKSDKNKGVRKKKRD